MKLLLEVKGLTKLFPVRGSRDIVTAVSDVSFDIMERETFGLIGESGSGKSTVGRCVLDLIRPSHGVVLYKGIEYSGLNKKKAATLRAEMQMVFQDPYYSLNPRKTVWDTVDDTLRVSRQLTMNERREMVTEALSKVYLDKDDFEKYPHQLSAGQQQRVGIARAIASNPRFIVLDEPTSSLDLSVRAEILGLLVKLQEELGVTYLFISHDLSTVQYLCHRVAVMYLGKIVEFGSSDQLFHNPQHPYSKALLASVMRPDPEIQRSQYRLSGEIPSAISLPEGCYLASRCPEAEDRCKTCMPPMVEVEKGHSVRCYHA